MVRESFWEEKTRMNWLFNTARSYLFRLRGGSSSEEAFDTCSFQLQVLRAGPMASTAAAQTPFDTVCVRRVRSRITSVREPLKCRRLEGREKINKLPYF